MNAVTPIRTAAYAAHPLHGHDRAYRETNCYTDVLIELLHSRGLEPLAGLGHLVRTDFEGDQFTFFKMPPSDMERLYGVDIHEMQPVGALPDQIELQLALGRTMLVELNSFFLPDTAATDYRRNHVKSTVAVEAIDQKAERLALFHNLACTICPERIIAGIFGLDGREPGMLPPYLELARFDAGDRLQGKALREAALRLLDDHLARRPRTNPFESFGAQLAADLPRLVEGDSRRFHAYAFATVRMAGASFDLLRAHLGWLLGPAAATTLDPIVEGCQILSFRLARRRAFDPAPAIAAMAEAWTVDNGGPRARDRLMRIPVEGWTPGRTALGDDVDAVFKTSFEAPVDGTLRFDGIATLATVTVDGRSVAESSSMWVPVEVPLAAGRHDIEVRCRALAPQLAISRKPRARWRQKVACDNNLRWFRTSLNGRAPGFAPGPPVVGLWRPVWFVAGEPKLTVRTRLEGDEGVVSLTTDLPDGVRVHVGGASATIAGGRAELRVTSPRLWWPHTHGEPYLYDVAVEGHDISRRIGFRTVELPGDILRDGLRPRINGVDLFVRGAVWTPVAEDEVRSTLETARDHGLNAVRLPGTMNYETSQFHDLCDELGILVWQDLMFANFDYPLLRPGLSGACRTGARRRSSRPSADTPACSASAADRRSSSRRQCWGWTRPSPAPLSSRRKSPPSWPKRTSTRSTSLRLHAERTGRCSPGKACRTGSQSADIVVRLEKSAPPESASPPNASPSPMSATTFPARTIRRGRRAFRATSAPTGTSTTCGIIIWRRFTMSIPRRCAPATPTGISSCRGVCQATL